MTYKTHINGGLLIGLYLTSQMPNKSILSTAVFLGGTFVGSILPDIDHKNSYIGQKAKLISKVINKVAGHRKLFHAPLIYLLFYSIIIGNVNNELVLLGIKGLFLGILSHLLLDSFTIAGLPWFYPFSKKKFSMSKIKTNSVIEDIVRGILIFINIIIVLDMIKITSIFTFTQK
jgi:inner membrane protein